MYNGSVLFKDLIFLFELKKIFYTSNIKDYHLTFILSNEDTSRITRTIITFYERRKGDHPKLVPVTLLHNYIKSTTSINPPG